MESNSTISQMITWLQALCISGGIARMAYCLVATQFNFDDMQAYKKRTKNLIYFLIISVCILEIIKLASSYF